MKVSEKIVIDLTKSFANVGVSVPFGGNFVLQDDLLPYPDAKLAQVSVQFEVTFLNPDVSVEGQVVCLIEGNCDRCLAPVKKQIVLPFEQMFFKDEAVEEEDYCYSGSKLDITKAVEDEIVLSLPTLLLCKPDCKGLCPKCGTNKNEFECGCDTEKENAFSVLKNLKF